MDEMTQQNSALVEESTAAARALTDQATKLAELMGFFKLEGMAMPSQQPTKASKPAPADTAPMQSLAVAGDDEGWNEF
jgi:hypothetical protein